MSRQSWTELFFLDEATAFAAGHRPCFFCRRDDAKRFRGCWEAGNGVSDLSAKAMDAILHAERLDRGKKRLHPMSMPFNDLPDGTMLQAGGESYLVAGGTTLRWSFAGYRRADVAGPAMLLTPPSTVRAFQAGYQPVLHQSAAAARG
jgi:hypothetical protein